MRKKLVSIILAFMLTCGYSGNVFSADARSDANKYIQEVLKNNNLNSGKTPLNALSIDEMDKKLLIGKISSVMHYKVGQLVAIQERDGNIALYDAGGYRATLSEPVEGSGKFEITNMQFRYTDIDWKTVKKETERKTEKETADWVSNYLGDYLTSIGFNGASAHELGTNLGSSVITFLKDHGVASSFSLVPDLILGTLKCTLNYEGKPQNTFDNNGDLTAEWIYDSSGALKQSIVYSFSVPAGESSGKWTATVTYYNDRGMETYTTRCDVINDNPSPSGSFDSFPVEFHLDYEKEVKTTTYEYDKSGSKIAEKNLETNDVTYYGQGRPLEIVHIDPDNGQKTIKSKYSYYAGGVLRSVVFYEEGIQTKVSIFSERGKQLIEGKDQDVEELFKQSYYIYDLIQNLNSDAKVAELLKYLSDHSITQLNLYADDLKNPYVFKTFFLDEDQQKEVEAKMEELEESGKGATPRDAVEALMTGLDENSDAYNLYLSVKQMFDSVSTQKGPITVGIAPSQKPGADVDTGRREHELQDQRSYGPDTNREHAADYHNGRNVDLSKGISSNTTVGDLYSEESGKGQYEADDVEYGYFDTYLDKTLQFSVKFVGADGLYETYTSERTISTEKTGTIGREVSRTAYYYDPAVVGQAQAFVDADGNVVDEATAQQMIAAGQAVFIKLNPQSINMFDGAGFQDITNPKEGEEIFVKVEDQAMFDAFKGSVGTGAQVMVVGVVTNDIDGKMTMQVYNTTNGAGVGFGLDSTGNKGYAIGSQVGGMVDEINRLSKEEGSWVYKNTQTNQGIFQAAGATDSSGYLRDWKDGWAALARLAGGK